jgi:hypothetical protein
MSMLVIRNVRAMLGSIDSVGNFMLSSSRFSMKPKLENSIKCMYESVYSNVKSIPMTRNDI